MRLNRKKPGLIVALTIIAEATSYPQTGTDHLSDWWRRQLRGLSSQSKWHWLNGIVGRQWRTRPVKRR